MTNYDVLKSSSSDILHEIGYNLNPEDLLSLINTCKDLNSVYNNNFFKRYNQKYSTHNNMTLMLKHFPSAKESLILYLKTNKLWHKDMYYAGINSRYYGTFALTAHDCREIKTKYKGISIKTIFEQWNKLFGIRIISIRYSLVEDIFILTDVGGKKHEAIQTTTGWKKNDITITENRNPLLVLLTDGVWNLDGWDYDHIENNFYR